MSQDRSQADVQALKECLVVGTKTQGRVGEIRQIPFMCPRPCPANLPETSVTRVNSRVWLCGGDKSYQDQGIGIALDRRRRRFTDPCAGDIGRFRNVEGTGIATAHPGTLGGPKHERRFAALLHRWLCVRQRFWIASDCQVTV